MLEDIVSEIKEDLPNKISAHNFIDIYVRARYVIGLSYAKSGDRESSEKHWRYVQEVCKRNLDPSLEITLYDKGEQILYFLESTNGIAMHALNRGEYRAVFDEIGDCLSALGKLAPDLVDDLGYQEIETLFASKYGVGISHQIFKAKRNLAIAMLLLGDFKNAENQIIYTVNRFEDSGDKYIQESIQIAQKLFDEQLK